MQLIVDSESVGKFRNLADGVSRLVEKLQHVCEHRGETVTSLNGIGIGFVDFDRTTQGLQPGQLLVQGARPGQGKTSMQRQFLEALR